MRRLIDRTLKISSDYWGQYCEAINEKDILLIDDSITTGSTIKQCCDIISECYEPNSITVLTLFSPLYDELGKELHNKK